MAQRQQHIAARFAPAVALVLFVSAIPLSAKDVSPSQIYPKPVQHVLTTYCFDCHGDGMEKGKVAFDQFESREDALARRDLWMMALKNLRAGIMPPEKKPRPDAAEQQALVDWIKASVFQIDPRNPDPGRVTIRRLNRIEYRNTIRDLTGFDFKVEEELPPDDTGYGFDTIGDVLTVSPLLLEKYMRAAETITADAVPRTRSAPAELTVAGADFHSASSTNTSSDRLSFYRETSVNHEYHAKESGTYHLAFEVEVLGQFEFDPGKCQVVFKADDQVLGTRDFGWQNGKKFNVEFDQKLEAGEHQLALELHPQTPAGQKQNSLDLRLRQVRVRGPLEERFATRPKNFDRFFWKDPPEGVAERQSYAREVLARFAKKAYRRPVEEKTVDRLVALAEEVYSQPGKSFADGIAQAMIPLLASPRFLFRVEQVEPETSRQKYPLIDEYALATRLSYFLWSTMPDDDLMALADHHELRKNLDTQVQRMIHDHRAQALVENFVGQWLQVRDLEGININEQVVLARDRGEDKERERRVQRFREINAIPEDKRTPEQAKELQQLIEQRRRRAQNKDNFELNGELRRLMRDETQMDFDYVMREDRSVLELVSSDYTFLNERLAKFYGITNVVGRDMRRVELPPDSPRGGVLTDGSTLIVTSNPTRTSPVKRGLFILDNILGMPPPPPPAGVPPLEASEKEFPDHQPTLRETLEMHRDRPLCSSCHSRMDPLGLSLENFNALGMWRDAERGAPIDAAGKLISGETFHDIRDVKQAIVKQRHLDFYRCLTEKLMTFAIGRGPEYYDTETVDRIVRRMDNENGRFSALLIGLVESAPFQRSRNPAQSIVSNSRSDKTVLK